MSYDLHLARVPPGKDALLVMAQFMEDDEDAPAVTEVRPEAEARKRRVADALVAVDGRLELFTPDHALLARTMQISETDARSQFRHIELTDPKDAIQITLHDETCSLSISYWHDPRAAAAVFDRVWIYLRILYETGGFQAYDPQLEKVLDLEKDRPAVLAIYGYAFSATHSTFSASLPRKRPWWKLW